MTEKSKTLWQSYYELNAKMNAPSITPEKREELRPLSTQIKHAAELAQLSGKQQEAVARIKALRKYTLETGFKTTRSQNDCIQQFDGGELADVLRAVNRG